MRYIIKTNNMGVVVSAFEMQKIAMTRNLPDDTIEVYEDYPEVENAIVVDSDAAPYIGYSTYINDVFNLNADAYTAGVASARAKADRLSEMRGIQSWFDSYYMQHEQKYNRLIALGQLCDD